MVAEERGSTGTTLFGWRDGSPSAGSRGSGRLFLSVIEGSHVQSEYELTAFADQRALSFGSAPDNDIVVTSERGIVSAHHGTLSVTPGGCFVSDSGSTNGLYANGVKRSVFTFAPGDIVSIGRLDSPRYNGVAMLLGREEASWRAMPLAGAPDVVTIGRTGDNDVVLPMPSVSAYHAVLQRARGAWYVSDCDSFNGVFVGGRRVVQPVALQRGDVLTIASSTLVFTGDCLVYSVIAQGVEVSAHDLVMRRPGRDADGGPLITTDHVSLRIRRGEFVAILGGSGAGKSTLLNELNGTDPATSGSVYVDGADLYHEYGALKNTIGYVPQQDIVYDDLRLVDMLRYAAELRMPPDTSREARMERVHEVLGMLDMDGLANRYIRSLSGGQRKRASIAVELLADPRLLYLDEPTSGLDPGIEKSLMGKLAALAHEGRTIVLVTHTTLNVSLCDRVVIMGAGGRLCFEGAPEEALRFFGVDDFVDIYSLIEGPDTARRWADWFSDTRALPEGGEPPARDPAQQAGAARSPSFPSQVSTLFRRYVRLIVNDRARLALLVLQAPVLAALICLVAGSETFDVYEGTKSCLFSLACAAFWIGLLDSIQEVCKERAIVKREYAGGVGVGAYIASKVGVLGALCVFQALVLSAVFALFEGWPPEALWNAPLENYLTSLLVMLSAMSLGLLVSAIFKNPDRAIALAPILIMPQILFSGLVFKLKGASKAISAIVNCRWGMEAYGTTANLNSLDLRAYRENDAITPDILKHTAEAAYDFTMGHLLGAWGALTLMCVVCIAACAVVLRAGIRK